MLVLLLSVMLFAGPPAHAPAVPTASADTTWEQERKRMVRTQIEQRGVTDPAVLRAMRTVPRHEFAPQHPPELTYQDRPLPIGHNQTISQPFIVAYMTELVRPNASDRVLEIGTGSGYQAAVLASIVDSVYTIEIVPDLAQAARERLHRLGYDNVVVKTGDGYEGWDAHAPYDIIVVTAAPERIPPPLTQQLKEGGRMILPVGAPFRTQQLMLVRKEDGAIRTETITPVRFVPLQRTNGG